MEVPFDRGSGKLVHFGYSLESDITRMSFPNSSGTSTSIRWLRRLGGRKTK
ncbi:MAG: hypothetical protein GXO63_00385 [Candidatus Micrarchaeota archaeon]|nr:hypothetical protein [Candidatus Micrarchaeota archaeon]